MTVKELKERLNFFPDNLQVLLTLPTADPRYPFGVPVLNVTRGVNELDGCLFLDDYKEESVENKNIFLISVFAKCELDDLGYTYVGACRCVGFRYSLELAREVIETNMCDIWEYSYDYACIEELGDELYPLPQNRYFYRYNTLTNVYEEIPEPEAFRMVPSMGIIG